MVKDVISLSLTHTQTHKNWNLPSHEKEGNPAICDNMDGPEGIM